ncbi:FHAD1 protein, partial [Nyctiprogne leucopyga]|nr:FHAD1 protein [Nyctiprogne leucopyga]
RDEKLQSIQEENEFQRQKLQEEIVGYKEQIKQHSLTIVALEERLLEAEQQQKTLEEENAALVGKMAGLQGDGDESTRGAWPGVSPVAESRCCLREELAAAQSALLSKDTVIAGLTKELVETRARMSDMRGELSEKQKVELEQNRSRVQCQERELKLLREKLSQMANLVEKRDGALQAAAEELRYMLLLEKRYMLYRKGGRQRAGEEGWRWCWSVNQLGCFFQEPALDLADLGAKCRGLRHEETIQRQKEGLAELRERVKMLEKRQPSVVMKHGSEPRMVLMKDLVEQRVQKTGLEKEPATVLGSKLKVIKVDDHVLTRGLHGAADGAVSLEMADETDLGEKMYLDIIGALGRLMKVKELSGMQSLKHLPQEEREKAGLQRRKDLELLYEKIRNLKSRLERKEEMLKDYEASVEQLRLNQESLRRCQEEMSKLEDEAYREAEEKALLREALERTQLQLSQEKVLRAAKLQKV